MIDKYSVEVSYNPNGGKFNAVVTVIEIESNRIVESYEFSAHDENHALYVAAQERLARNRDTEKEH